MIYGLDTETDYNSKTQTAFIVQWCIHNGKKAWTGKDLESLKKRLLKLPGRFKNFIYVHNLNYDLEFFKYALYEIAVENDGDINPVWRKGKAVSVTLRFNGKTLIFRDSLKKWQGNLKSMGEAIGLPKLDPPEEDFAEGWSQRVDMDDPEQWKYVIRDAEIVAVGMRHQHDMGASKATTSGDAWKSAHEIINDGYNVKGKTKWDEYFPPLAYELDHALRPAFWGGINISRHRGETVPGPITHLDRVSMYPSVMYFDPLPFGPPIYIGEELPLPDDLYIMKLKIRFNIKEGHIPWMTFKNGVDCAIEDINAGEVVEHCQQWHYMTLTSVDLDTLNMDYDVEIDPEYPTETWIFKSRIGIMRPYIDKWIKVKKEAKKGSAERAHAKRMLNALYGRYSLIQESELCALEYDPEKDDLAWITQLTVSENDAYLPYSAFCTAWARRSLTNKIREIVDVYGPEAIIHCDTDSVIYKGEPVGEIGSDLGQWGIEHTYKMIHEGGPKRYCGILDMAQDSLDCFSIACAGVPQPEKEITTGDRTDRVPSGMWIHILDDPPIITRNVVLGDEHYRIKSKWLRDLYLAHGKNPDDCDTTKIIGRRVQGGIIFDKRQHELSDNIRFRFNRAL